ncbi:hypothetical protein [Planktothrix sp. FACHB-1365]|uniref:hypothetical protein n=1 Tax=Planktothrix sp. FACHB-1365 TaxID=2692855 RepID=UPI00168474ED|nr:hypothetical protein [Planktothrix sp. FACHB-1365]MBD2485023.1 hypothetical protein [Planktothrix sp. FACHB-1365]
MNNFTENNNNNTDLIAKANLLQAQETIENVDKFIQDLSNQWPNDIEFPINFVFLERFGPLLFLDVFPSLPLETIRPIMVAEKLLGTSLVMCDWITDRTNDAFLATKYGLSIQAMQLEGYHILYSIFPPNSKFWQRFRNYYQEYMDACIKEQKFASGELPFSEYTEELAIEITANKSAPIKSNIAALVELSGDESLFEPLTAAVKQYLIARQIWDDIQDWKEDLQFGIPSLLLSRIIQEWPIKPDEINLKSLTKKMYYGGHINYVIEIACQSLELAKELTKDISELAWRSVAISALESNFKSLSHDIEKICNKNIESLQK